MKPLIDVIIPSIPPREQMLLRAIDSAYSQTLLPNSIHVLIDDRHDGAAVTRNRGLKQVGDDVEFIAFLDDDDFFYEHHLETLYNLSVEHEADFMYSWFSGCDPFPQHRGRQFNPDDPHHTTMCVMVRAELAKAVGFRTDHPEGWILAQEDWRFILDCRDRGAKFAGTAEVTWHYSLHEYNTSGMGKNW